jgi:hypothetical protein
VTVPSVAADRDAPCIDAAQFIGVEPFPGPPTCSDVVPGTATSGLAIPPS